MFILLIIALLAAGIFTHSIVWYVLAGVLVGLMLIVSLVALMGAGAALKEINKDLDNGFDNDFIKNNRPGRYHR